MSRHNSGTFLDFQSLSLAGMGGATLTEAMEATVADLIAGASLENTLADEVMSLVNTTLDDIGYKPNGDHLAGRNVESELIAGREKLLIIQTDTDQDAALRAAIIPEIAKIELQITQRDFMRPIHDPEWGADITEIVMRIAPHAIIVGKTDAGIDVVQTVSLKLDTLRVEVDDYGEICAWIYEESP